MWGKHSSMYLYIVLVSYKNFCCSLFSDKGKPLVISADLYVEAFGNIKEANMVSLSTTTTRLPKNNNNIL